METVESINWLKKNKLFELCENAASKLKNIFMPCLMAHDEKILILGDRGHKNRRVAPILAGGYYTSAISLNLNTKLVLQAPKSRGMDSDDYLISSLESLQEKSIVFVCMSDKLGGLKHLGKSFRKFCEKKRLKYITTTSLGDLDIKKADQVLNAINVNYKPLQDKHRILKEIFDNGKELRVKTEAGTELYYDISSTSAVASDGKFDEFGKGGNLPAGEVYIAPNGRNVEGKVVIDGSSRTHFRTTVIKRPIILTINEGSIVNIEGGKEAALLEKTLTWAENKSKHPSFVRRIGEFGVGLNPNAAIIGASIIDEKALGTAHVGIGSNYWFGGSIYGIIHLDQIFKNPKVYVDNLQIEI